MIHLYEVDGDTVRLNLHPGQQKAWNSEARFVFVFAGTQGGKTSFIPWWLHREIQRCGRGDYIAATSSYDLFKLKLLPEIQTIFEHVLRIGKYWKGDKVMEICHPETREFLGKSSSDPNMYARIILRSAASEGGLESTTAKAAVLDEVGQDDFGVGAWEAVLRRLSLSRGRILGTTTLYNLGWLKQQVYDRWERGDKTIDIIQFPSVMNPLFSQEEFEDAKTRLPDWKFRMQYLGEFTKPAGMIYSDFINLSREQGGHLVKPFTIPQHFPRYAGVDPGAVNHAMLWIAHDTELDIFYVYRELMEGDKSTAEHAQNAHELARQQQENVVLYAVGQKSEVQQRLDWKAAGVDNVIEPPFHDVESGIDRVIGLLRQHRIFFFDNLYQTLDMMARYTRKLDENGDPTDKIKDKERFHLLDALRYVAAQITEPAQISVSTMPAENLYKRRKVPLNV